MTLALEVPWRWLIPAGLLMVTVMVALALALWPEGRSDRGST